MICVKCNQETYSKETVCSNCHKAEQSRANLIRRQNDNWMTVAEENEIELYNRQPGESDREWYLWQQYMQMYPNEKPNLRIAGERAGVDHGLAKKYSSRWDYAIRIKAWAAHVDVLLSKQRADNVIAMNQRHIDLAAKLHMKVEAAVDLLDPHTMKPAELNGLMKTLTEMERKAYGDTTESVKSDVGLAQSTDKITKIEDLSEVIGILSAAGALKGKTVGIEKTERVVIRDEISN